MAGGYKVSEAYVEIQSAGLDSIFKDLSNIGGSIPNVASNLEGLNVPIGNLGGQLTSLVGSIGMAEVAFIGLGVAVAAAAVDIGTKAVAAASKLEDALAEVSTLVDTTIVDMSKMSRGVTAMSTDVFKSSTQLSNGLYQVISAGVDAGESLDVLGVAAKSATAGLTDTFTSVDVLTNVLNAYGLETAETQRVSDLLFGTIKEGKTRFAELAGSLGRVLPIAASLNIPLEELLGSIAQLTKGGLSTSESVTAIRSALSAFMSPAESANDLLGEQANLLSASAIKSKGLIASLSDLTKAIGSDEAALAKLLGRQEAVLAATALVGAQMGKTQQTIADVGASTGETERAFAKMTDTFSAQTQKFSLQVEKALLGIGEELLPSVTEGMKALNAAMSLISTSPLERLTASAQESADAVRRQWQEAEQLESRLSPLLNRYDQLKRRYEDASQAIGESAEATAQAEIFQRELQQVVERIVEIVPEAARGFDEYGKAMDISTQAVRSFITAQKSMSLKRIIDEATELQRELNKVATVYKNLQKAAKQPPTVFTPAFTGAEGQAFVLHQAFREAKDRVKEMRPVLNALQKNVSDIFSQLPRSIRDNVTEFFRLQEAGENTETVMNDIVVAVGRINPELAANGERVRELAEALGEIGDKLTKVTFDVQLDIPEQPIQQEIIGPLQAAIERAQKGFADITITGQADFDDIFKEVDNLQSKLQSLEGISIDDTSLAEARDAVGRLANEFIKLPDELKANISELRNLNQEGKDTTYVLRQTTANLKNMAPGIDEDETKIKNLDKTGDVLANSLSPLGQLNTIFPYTLDELKAQTHLLSVGLPNMGGQQEIVAGQPPDSTEGILANPLLPLEALNPVFPAILDELKIQTNRLAIGLPNLSKPQRGTPGSLTEEAGITVEGDVHIHVQEVSEITPEEINRQLHRETRISKRRTGAA